MKKYSKEWWDRVMKNHETKTEIWNKQWKKANACTSCGEQKKTVIVGTDHSACPKSLPVTMTSRECKTEGCKDFHEGRVW